MATVESPCEECEGRRFQASVRGLHLADVENLLRLLDRLVYFGRPVIVIEHHQAVMAHADWIIDLGPGAGRDGGRVSSRARRPTSWPRGPPWPTGRSWSSSSTARRRCER